MNGLICVITSSPDTVGLNQLQSNYKQTRASIKKVMTETNKFKEKKRLVSRHNLKVLMTFVRNGYEGTEADVEGKETRKIYRQTSHNQNSVLMDNNR